MPDSADLTLTAIAGLDQVEGAEWDACAGADNPFLSWDFLQALEESGSADAEAGWQPRHLLIKDAAGRLVAAAPAYLKAHSYGEYVFDHGWADAWERAGGRYFPKLLTAVPFTPAPGPRLLVREGEDRALLADALRQGLESLAEQSGSISAHVNFALDADRDILLKGGWLGRSGLQFHWPNRGYQSFDDFLAALSSRKRKAVRKERKTVAESGVEVVTLSGGDLTRTVWDAFFHFYQATSDRKWGYPYLTRRFFDLLGERLGEKVVLVMARKDGDWIAGALNLRGADTLYGRNWGCVVDVPCLHFEACYYRAIDYAIAHGLETVEAGAQGPHKLQRGYLPVETHSAHWIGHDGFRDAVEAATLREARHIRAQIAALAEESPYRKVEPA